MSSRESRGSALDNHAESRKVQCRKSRGESVSVEESRCTARRGGGGGGVVFDPDVTHAETMGRGAAIVSPVACKEVVRS